MHGSIFGGSINNVTKFPEGPGFGFSRNNRPLIERVGFGIDELLIQIKNFPAGYIESLEQVVDATENILGLLKVLVDDPIKGSLFFQRNPSLEIPRMVDLLIESKFDKVPFPIAAPVCPDYQGNYKLGTGVGKTAEKVLRTYPIIKNIFAKFDVDTKLRIDVADVEAYDSNILKASGETTESFLYKTNLTRESIEHAANSNVEVITMNRLFRNSNFEYHKASSRNAYSILDASSGTKARVRDQLIQERQKAGDLELINSSDVAMLISFELGGYGAYGEYIAGSAAILSPDAMSAIPAYHFGVTRPEEFSPIIYIQK